jgi:5-methylcytosine-specific restriction enzyme A
MPDFEKKGEFMRNPPWVRDELILALDLYFEVNPLHTSEEHPQIIALSELLNSLPIHPSSSKLVGFRNPSGVYMKLCNFLRLDPTYKGKGLTAGSKLDEVVWDEFSSNIQRLRQTVLIIRKNYSQLSRPQNKNLETEIVDENEEFPEGKIITRLHKNKERNHKLAKQKKAKVLQTTGKLVCEVCLFDFASYYGDMGKGFIECHHNRPLADLDGEHRVKLSDISVICPNCHRMIHRVRPWLRVEQLREIVKTNELIER